MTTSRSLLDFVDAPVVVGDPDGRAVYVNPAFEAAFAVDAAQATGVALASLFGGGAREAVLSAVARVCGGDGTVQFRLREVEGSYAALASPIVAEHDRVGVVILLTEELEGDDRLVGFHRTLQEPLDELTRCLQELSDYGGTDVRRSVDDGMRAIDTLRKQAEVLQKLFQGGGPSR